MGEDASALHLLTCGQLGDGYPDPRTVGRRIPQGSLRPCRQLSSTHEGSTTATSFPSHRYARIDVMDAM